MVVPVQGTAVAEPPAVTVPAGDGLDHQIHLKHRTIPPGASVDRALLAKIKQGPRARHAIVQLHNLPQAHGNDLEQLSALGGVRGLSTTYVAAVSPGVRTDAAAWSRLVRSVVRIKDSDKLHRLLGAPDAPPDVLIHSHADVSVADAEAVLTRIGVDAAHHGPTSWRGAATRGQLTRPSQEDAVQWIEPTQRHEILLDGTRAVGNVDPVQQLDVDSGGKRFTCSLGTLANATPSSSGRATARPERPAGRPRHRCVRADPAAGAEPEQLPVAPAQPRHRPPVLARAHPAPRRVGRERDVDVPRRGVRVTAVLTGVTVSPAATASRPR